MLAINKTAKRDYEIIDRFEAGMVLFGHEVKSVKHGGMKLTGSYVKLVDGEIFLLNAYIAPYQFARVEDYDTGRTRKLLLSKKELIRIGSKLSQKPNLTLVALNCYNKKGRIKVEIALARGKKTWEVKRIEKERSERKRESSEAKEWMKK